MPSRAALLRSARAYHRWGEASPTHPSPTQPATALQDPAEMESGLFDKDSIANCPSGRVVKYFTHIPNGPIQKTDEPIPLIAFRSIAPSDWKPLPLPACLGVGLAYLTKDAKSESRPCVKRQEMLEVLTTDCDPASAEFGKAACDTRGGVVFKYDPTGPRMNRLSILPLESLQLFIMKALADMKAALAEEGLDSVQRLYAAAMTPIAFKLFFKRYRAALAEREESKGWEREVCPVRVEIEHCEGCGREQSEERTVMRCSRCKVVYCGKVCQMEDWKAHRFFGRAG